MSAHHRRSHAREKRYMWLRIGLTSAAWLGVVVLVLVIKPSLLASAWAFPIGLMVWLPPDFVIQFGFYLVWIAYLALTYFTASTKRGRLFFLLYLVLCALLAINVVGCYQLSQRRFD